MAGTYTFTNAKTNSIGVTPVVVYTNPNPLATMLVGLMIGNKHTSQIVVDVTMAGITILKGATIPAGGALPMLDQGGKVPLLNGETVEVTSDIADSATCILGLMEEV